jgi:hypothetical protein
MNHLKWTALVGFVFVLAACGNAADTLGIGRNAPDEFAVVDRPPLSLPPDFELHPPRPGAPRPQEVSTPDRASQIVFGGAPQATESSEKTDAEKALLAAAGANKAEPDIRSIVDRETTQKVVGTRHLVDELLWWHNPNAAATTVDAPAEAQRLKEAKEKGEATTTGATPIIERGKTSWLGL